MAYTQRQYEIASRRSGVPVSLLRLVSGQEAGGEMYDRHGRIKTSPKGAQGGMQLMPGTARGLEKRYKINTRTPMGNLLGGAFYLMEQKRSFGSWRLALAAYNAGPGAVKDYDGIPPYSETRNYVRNIMDKWKALGGSSTTPAAQGTRASTGIPSRPQVPQIDKEALALEGMQRMAAGDYDPNADLQSLHEAMLAASQAAKQMPQQPLSSSKTPQTGSVKNGEWNKYVALSKSADRQGVQTSPEILQFAGMLGMRMGRKLVVGTGTNHNRFVKGTQRESAHWQGHAVDIPASGKELTRLGRQALILAGMTPAEARKARGGVYNIGGYQIIFNSDEGGNHWNHIHIGLRR